MRGGRGGWQHLSSHSEKYQVVPALLSNSLSLMLSNKRGRIVNRTRALSKRLTSVGHFIYLTLFFPLTWHAINTTGIQSANNFGQILFLKLTTEKLLLFKKKKKCGEFVTVLNCRESARPVFFYLRCSILQCYLCFYQDPKNIQDG